jgi:hypothetical protein
MVVFRFDSGGGWVLAESLKPTYCYYCYSPLHSHFPETLSHTLRLNTGCHFPGPLYNKNRTNLPPLPRLKNADFRCLGRPPHSFRIRFPRNECLPPAPHGRTIRGIGLNDIPRRMHFRLVSGKDC